MAQGTEPKTHLGEGNTEAQLWKSTASSDSKFNPLTAGTPARCFKLWEKCKKEKTDQIMGEKKWRKMAIDYSQLKEVAEKEIKEMWKQDNLQNNSPAMILLMNGKIS